MNINAFIGSGILTNYCLGFCTAEEIAEIEMLSAIHPLIKEEIETIRHGIEEQLLLNTIAPSPSVKVAVMRSVYKQQATTRHEFPPLIDETISKQELEKWVLINNIKSPTEDFENLSMTALPSTEHVINFIVAAKMGHEQEVHEDFIEYLFVIKGSCTMNFDGMKRSYSAGDLIAILPHINHSAVITSMEPMLALVQRQKNV
ncbi:MAG: cupin domain-containing protein [Ferruginibacter sp.]